MQTAPVSITSASGGASSSEPLSSSKPDDRRVVSRQSERPAGQQLRREDLAARLVVIVGRIVNQDHVRLGIDQRDRMAGIDRIGERVRRAVELDSRPAAG